MLNIIERSCKTLQFAFITYRLFFDRRKGPVLKEVLKKGTFLIKFMTASKSMKEKTSKNKAFKEHYIANGIHSSKQKYK